MKNHKKLLKFVVPACVLAFCSLSHAGIVPYGIQTGVTQSTVDSWGWQECSRSGSYTLTSIQGILTACQGEYLMMGVWDRKNNVYSILGAGEYDVVSAITDYNYYSDDSGRTLNNWSNGINFYRTQDKGSWGFTNWSKTWLNGADMNLNPSYGSPGAVGVSFTTNDGVNLGVGYGFNATGGYTFQFVNKARYDRVFFAYGTAEQPQPPAVPEPSALALVGTALAGLALNSRRKKRWMTVGRASA